jgi:ribosomal protein L39E
MSYRTMQGRVVDMEKLMRQNELVPAVGNMKTNARGDQLGPGGKIIKKREEIVAEYYEANPKAAPRKGAGVGVQTTTVAEAPAPTIPTTKSKKPQSEE